MTRRSGGETGLAFGSGLLLLTLPQMTKDPLKQFSLLRDSMLRKKASIEKELADINAALGEFSISSSPPIAGSGGRKRAENSMSLLEAVLTVTKAKPLAKREILEAIQKQGYKFAAKAPMNSLNTLLYSSEKVKKVDGKFGPK